MQSAIAIAPHHAGVAARGLAEHADLRRRTIADAIQGAGGRVAPQLSEARGLVWLDVGDARPLVTLLDENPQIAWVQLPWAGVESFSGTGLFERPVRFTCAKSSYGEQVGEHALVLALARCGTYRSNHAYVSGTHENPSRCFVNG